MIAALAMYARPELDQAHARYWQLIRQELRGAGIDAPEKLTEPTDESEPWTDPALVLSQTCSMPYRTSLHGRVSLIGTPDFGVSGCAPGYYRSAIVVRRADPRPLLPDYQGATFAFNQTGSQSGYNAAVLQTAPHGFWFQRQLETGSHLASARAVADGQADIAALDAISWRLMQRYDDFATRLRILELTEPTPGLPYISALGADQPTMFEAITNAIASLAADDRDALGIRGLVNISAADYLAVPNWQ